MSSHLTRSVFQRIIRGRPIQPRGCIRRVQISNFPRDKVSYRDVTQKRYIFGFGAPKMPKGWSKGEQIIQQNLEILQSTSKKLAEKIRTPPPSEIAKALVAFFAECQKSEAEVTDLHTKSALDAWLYLEKIDEANLHLSEQDAKTALDAMGSSYATRSSPQEWNPYHQPSQANLTPQDVMDKESYPDFANHLARFIRSTSGNLNESALLSLITCLARSGRTVQALEFLQEAGPSAMESPVYWQPILKYGDFETLSAHKALNLIPDYVNTYIRSLAASNGKHSLESLILNLVEEKVNTVQDVTALMKTAWDYEMSETHPLMRKLDEAFDRIFAASQVDSANIVEWCNIKLARTLSRTKLVSSLDLVFAHMTDAYDAQPDGKAVVYLLRAVLRNEKLPVGNEEVILQTNNRIANVLDWATRNVPGDHAFQRDLELFYFWIEQGFITQATECFERLRSAEIVNDQYAIDFERAEERMLQSLCKLDKTTELQQELVSEIIESQAVGRRWQPDTLAALALDYLRQGAYDDLVALLNENVSYFGVTDRRKVVDSIVEFAFDPSMSKDGSGPNPNHTWNTYVMLMTTGLPVNREVLTRFMMVFINARFLEETVQAFNYMRSNPGKQIAADESVYIKVLRGIGAFGELNSVRAIHNQLKLDTRVEPSAPIWTELLMAYAICDQSVYALTFWEELFDLPGEPSERSVLAALSACETSLRGSTDLDRVWSDVITLEIPLTSEIFAAYIAALASVGKSQDAKAEIEANAEKYDRISAVGNLLSIVPPFDSAGEEMIEWIKMKYPQDYEKILQYERPSRKLEGAEQDIWNRYLQNDSWE